MRGISFFGYYQRMAAIAVATSCIFFCVPQVGICAGNVGILNQVKTNDLASAKKEFDKLAVTIESSPQSPIDEGFAFLQLFIEEINAKYGVSLTLLDACVLLRENLHILPITLDQSRILVKTIELLEFKSSPVATQDCYFE